VCPECLFQTENVHMRMDDALDLCEAWLCFAKQPKPSVLRQIGQRPSQPSAIWDT